MGNPPQRRHSSSPPPSWPWRPPTPAATAPLSSPPSLPGSLRRRALPYSRAFWWEDPALCEANLPGFWANIAAILWPGYWDPSADWMCAPICAAPEDTVMTCDDCKMGIQAAIDQMLATETLDTIVEF